jgi:hypothetical protein
MTLRPQEVLVGEQQEQLTQGPEEEGQQARAHHN